MDMEPLILSSCYPFFLVVGKLPGPDFAGNSPFLGINRLDTGTAKRAQFSTGA